MKKSIAILSAIAAVSAVALIAQPAHAEDVSVQLSGAPAENLWAPWSAPFRNIDHNKFKVGGAADARVMFKLVPNLSVGPEVMVYDLPVSGSNDSAAVLWSFGGAARLQGVRGDNAWSPYLQVGGAASTQAGIVNPTLNGSVGADFAVDPTHTLWVGPFIGASRTFQTHSDNNDQTLFMNHHDGSVLTVGLSVSFDAPVRPHVVVENTITERVVEHTNVVVAPAPAPVAPPVVATPAPQAFRLTERVAFDKNSSTLNTTSTMTLDEVAKEIAAHPGVQVRVEGSASAEGDASYNLTLSHLRAGVVATYLATHGVDPSILVPVSVGATGAPNDASNRAVDFIVINLVNSGR